MISFRDFVNEKRGYSINESKLLFTMYGENEDGYLTLQSFGFTYKKIDFEMNLYQHGELNLTYWKNNHSKSIKIKDPQLIKVYEKYVSEFENDDIEEKEFHDSKLEKLLLKHLDKIKEF